MAPPAVTGDAQAVPARVPVLVSSRGNRSSCSLGSEEAMAMPMPGTHGVHIPARPTEESSMLGAVVRPSPPARRYPSPQALHPDSLCSPCSSCPRMEGSEELESSLLTQPWASVCLGKSTFLAKVCFRDTGYILLISDLSSVWYESADAEAVGQRSKELNKRLTVQVSSFLHHLCKLMRPLLAGQPDATTSFSCHRTASGLSLHMKSELSGLPFYWDFHCCPAPVEMVSRHLVRPLIQMSLALQSQVQKLSSLLLQKDAEIEDYRESGATLSRDRLRTEPFQEEAFQQHFMVKSLPQICNDREGQAFTSTLQQLYMAVTQQEARQAQKRQHSEDAEDPAPPAETTGQPHPPPPSQEDETASSSEGITPTSSPAQKPRIPAAKTKPKKAKGLFS